MVGAKKIMDKSKLYKGKLCGYCEVERLKDEKLLKACDKAASIISSHEVVKRHGSY